VGSPYRHDHDLPLKRTTRCLPAVIFAGLAAAASASATAHPPAQSALASRLSKALAAPGLSPRQTSALAVDLVSGKVVFSHNATLALAPASNEKLPVSFAALVRLGPGYRFHTEVLGDGDLVDGTWRGDLYLRGFGDPTLTRWDLRALAAQVRAWGIRRVRGAVVGDESWFDRRRDSRGWKPWFLGDESAPLSALVVERADGWPRLSPAQLAARSFQAALSRRGIRVTKPSRTGPTPPEAFPLARDLSAPLAEIVRVVNRESDNFVSEMLLKALGADAGAGGTTLAGARVVREALAEAHVPLGGLRIVDGSGLSRLDRLSATTLVGLLRAGASDPEIRHAFLSSLAVAGVDGTLEDRMQRRPAYGRVVAKTGTTMLASCLSGFVRGRYVFAVLQNGSPIPAWTARAAQDRFATLLAAA
jgi:serine-type D-Ala-D-Ala carboxypeptidase/endopeptidase (penicillin-binding protein 4)